MAGAHRAQAHLACTHGSFGASADQDIALCGQAAFDHQSLLGLHHDVSVAATCDQVAFEHGISRWGQEHAPAQSFHQTGGRQQHALSTSGAHQGVEVDGVIGFDVAHQGDGAAFFGRVANGDRRSPGTCFQGRHARRHFGAARARGAGRGDLVETQALGIAIGVVDVKQITTAGQLQATIDQAHLHHRVGNAQIGQGGLHIRHQAQQVGVVTRGAGRQADHALRQDGVAGQGASVHMDAKSHRTCGHTAGQLRKAISHDLLRPCRGGDGQVAVSAQAHFAVFAEGRQAHIAPQDHTIVQLRVQHRGRRVAGSTAHIDQLARDQAFAQGHLAFGLDGDGGVTVKITWDAAKVSASGIVVIVNGATGHDVSVEQGVACSRDVNAPIGVVSRHFAAAGQAHAQVLVVDPSHHGDVVVRAEGATELRGGAVACSGHATQINSPHRGQADVGGFVHPVHALRHQVAIRIDLLHLTTCGDVPHDADVAHSIDHD